MEELEELEPLDDGEISAISPAPPRTSVPPPIPKQALEQRVTQVGVRPSPLIDSRGSAPPPLRSSLPPQRSSLPPAPPPAGASVPPSSGVYRVAESKSELDRWKDVVRELELKVRLRDDLISELKRSHEEHKKLMLAAETRASAAEARASAAEARATEAEARAASEVVRVPVVAADDLKRIKGIGPAFERKLHTLGVSSYEAIANWTEADIERIAEALAILPQRITRDGWLENARKLSQQAFTRSS